MKERYALELASRGFYVFPIIPNGKTPAVSDWQEKATRDPAQLKQWFTGSNYNLGIYTGRFGDDEALIVVDVDNKKGKDGDAVLFGLELDGFGFPATLEQTTPTGGRHLIYRTPAACKQGANVLGAGLDIRSRGGYIVAPGSEIDGGKYAVKKGRTLDVEFAPDWLVDRLGVDVAERKRSADVLPGVDPDRAAQRALAYLETAPVAIEGNSGDLTTYKVAAKLKDFGCTEAQAFALLSNHWNDECDPPWPLEELEDKINHAYRYGQEPAGVAAPEANFSAVETATSDEGEHPLDTLNRTHAFISNGSYILEEGFDQDEQPQLMRHSVADFHAWSQNRTMQVGDKQVPLSKLWMSDKRRREYQEVVFDPAGRCSPRFYNMWRGFAYEPAEQCDLNHPGVKAWRHHLLHNCCRGDEQLAAWLTGWFAHLVQHPGEKPLVALVFRGRKGTGKNALIERVGALLGRHFIVADDDRYLLSNFNSHLEACLALVLDEACWGGDKRAEGKLKGLITGKKHNIERKGFEPYKVDNLTRVVIIGNEDWLVPASEDERRFAVLTMGEGNMQDRSFFHNMRVDLENGGYPHLLRYLLDVDLRGIDVNEAPATTGLVEQKIASLDMTAQWWHACLHSQELEGGDFDGWPETVPTKRLLACFERFMKARNTRARLPDPVTFGKTLASFGLERKRIGKSIDGSTYVYIVPHIDTARAVFMRRIGGDVNWPKE